MSEPSNKPKRESNKQWADRVLGRIAFWAIVANVILIAHHWLSK